MAIVSVMEESMFSTLASSLLLLRLLYNITSGSSQIVSALNKVLLPYKLMFLSKSGLNTNFSITRWYLLIFFYTFRAFKF